MVDRHVIRARIATSLTNSPGSPPCGRSSPHSRGVTASPGGTTRTYNGGFRDQAAGEKKKHHASTVCAQQHRGTARTSAAARSTLARGPDGSRPAGWGPFELPPGARSIAVGAWVAVIVPERTQAGVRGHRGPGRPPGGRRTRPPARAPAAQSASTAGEPMCSTQKQVTAEAVVTSFYQEHPQHDYQGSVGASAVTQT